MILLLSAIAPAVIIMYLIYLHDLEREPIKMLVKSFFGGVLSVVISLFLVYALQDFIPTGEGPISMAFCEAFFEAAIPEELSKWIIFFLLIKNAKHFDQYYDGILYAIFISMGFALIENILYVVDGGIGTAIMRAILSVPGHMLFAVPMGYFLSISKFEHGNISVYHILMSILVPVLLHGTFDFILMFMSSIADSSGLFALFLFVIFLFFDIYLWRQGLRRIKIHIRQDQNRT
jgi:RsiW-degrading membrane proteinase PrsW (M82 family)